MVVDRWAAKLGVMGPRRCTVCVRPGHPACWGGGPGPSTPTGPD